MGGLHRQLRRVRTWARWADAGGTVEVGALHTNGGANGRPSRESDGDCLGALSDKVDYDIGFRLKTPYHCANASRDHKMLGIGTPKQARSRSNLLRGQDPKMLGVDHGLQTGSQITHNLNRDAASTRVHPVVDYRGAVRDDARNRPGGGSKQGLK